MPNPIVFRRVLMNSGAVHVPAPAGYTGPVDAVAGAAHYWGLRAATSALIGANAIELREDGGNTLQTFATIAGGGLDLAAIATFKGSASLFVRRIYDQIGTDHFTQTNNSDQPTFTLNVAAGGTLPVVGGGATGRYLQVTLAGGAISQPSTVALVARRTSGTSDAYIAGGTATGIWFANVADRISASAGTTVSVNGATENQFHSINIAFNGASSNLSVDGANNPVNLNTGTIAAQIGYLAWAGQGSAANAEMLEQIIYTSALSAGNLAALDTNQSAYWGY